MTLLNCMALWPNSLARGRGGEGSGIGMKDVDALLVKASKNLEAARTCNGKGLFDPAASRYYYVCVQATLAWLAGLGENPSGSDNRWHHREMLDRLTVRLPLDRSVLCGSFRTLRRLREDADYEPVPVLQSRVEKAAGLADEFLRVMQVVISQLPPL